MDTVVVERSFERPGTCFDDLEALERTLGACMEIRRVRPLGSYFSRDRRKLVCLYESPDAESVRELQDKAALPYDRVWSATKLGDGSLLDPRPLTLLVVQRELPEVARSESLPSMLEAAMSQLHGYQAEHIMTLLRRDRSRALGFYKAPEAEVLRLLNERLTPPSEYVFPASAHMPV